MTMSERAAQLAQRLERVHAMQDKVVEAGVLSQLHGELSPVVQKFAAIKGRVSVLSEAAVQVSAPVTLDRFRQKARKLRDEFTENPKASTLKRGQTWVSMMADGETVAQEMSAAIKSAWQAHRTNLYAGKTHSALESELAKTEENKVVLLEYKEVFDQFRFLFDTVPTSLEVVDRAKKLAARLEVIAARFDYQVSAPVKAFLDAVQTVQGAQLSLLTDEVMDWLRQNRALGSYRVKAVDRT